jgi:hypothetical protein
MRCDGTVGFSPTSMGRMTLSATASFMICSHACASTSLSPSVGSSSLLFSTVLKSHFLLAVVFFFSHQFFAIHHDPLQTSSSFGIPWISSWASSVTFLISPLTIFSLLPSARTASCTKACITICLWHKNSFHMSSCVYVTPVRRVVEPAVPHPPLLSRTTSG